jgi:hypothetical protein
MVEMKTFNLNENLQQLYDDVANLEMGNLIEVSRLVIGSISMPSGLVILLKTLKSQAT